MLAKCDPVPLDLLVRSNLTVNVAPDVMRKLRDLLIREVEKRDHEWVETMQRLTITERTEKRPVAIRNQDVQLDCRSIVNQLVSPIPKYVFLRTSYVERQQVTGTQTAQEVSLKLKSSVARRVQFTDAREKYEPLKRCPGSQVISGLARMICPGSPR